MQRIHRFDMRLHPESPLIGKTFAEVAQDCHVAIISYGFQEDICSCREPINPAEKVSPYMCLQVAGNLENLRRYVTKLG